MSAPAAPSAVTAAAAPAASTAASASAAASSSASSLSYRPSAQQSQPPPLSMFTPAPQADLFRALQKDEYMLARWRDEWSELSASFLGGGAAARYEPELDLLCRAAYFGTTSLVGGATLGEEYCDVMQVAPVRVYEQFRRERGERRAERRRSRELAQAAHTHTHAADSSGVAVEPVAQSGAGPAALSPAPLPSTVLHTTPSAGPSPVAAPLFAWARYNSFELPSVRRRSFLFFLQVLAPYLYEKLQRNVRRLQFDTAAAEAHLRTEQERRRRFEDNDMPIVQLDEEGDANANAASVSRLRFPLLPRVSFPSSLSLSLKLAWNRCVSLLLRADYTLVNQLHRLHLSLFYLAGRYLELSKRTAGIQYVQLRKLDVARPGYELFGILMLIQVVVSMIRILRQAIRGMREEQQQQRGDGAADGEQLLDSHALHSGSLLPGGDASASGLYALSEGERAEEAEEQREMHVQDVQVRPSGHPQAALAAAAGQQQRGHHPHPSHPAIDEEAEEEADASDSDDDADAVNCTLCLCPRVHTTATECGHLFCWECISECITNKPECPLCRQPCALNMLLLLPQYK